MTEIEFDMATGTCPGCGSAYVNGECLRCDGDGNPWYPTIGELVAQAKRSRRWTFVAGWIMGMATAVLLFATITFERSDYALHTYSVPGHQGVIVGDCYHLNAGYEVETGWFINAC